MADQELNELEAMSWTLASGLRDVLPHGIGFCLVLFDEKHAANDDGPGRIAYVSSGERVQVVEQLKAIAQQLEAS